MKKNFISFLSIMLLFLSCGEDEETSTNSVTSEVSTLNLQCDLPLRAVDLWAMEQIELFGASLQEWQKKDDEAIASRILYFSENNLSSCGDIELEPCSGTDNKKLVTALANCKDSFDGTGCSALITILSNSAYYTKVGAYPETSQWAFLVMRMFNINPSCLTY